MGALLALAVVLLALLGMPLFSVMGGSSELLWLTHDSENLRFLRFIAPNVLDDRFAGSPILVTIPLFTFVGYTMAESKTPDRIVRASQAFFGWMPGGLAIVCIFASAFFTTLTGGSGVTIVAIGGLLYPALRKQGYPDNYALGLVTTGGSLGLLLPPALPIMVYALVAQIDINATFKAVLIPGFLVMGLLAGHAIYTGLKYNIPRSKPNLKEMGGAVWLIKWELAVPVLIIGGIFTGLTSIDESAALAAVYTLAIEVFVYKDLTIKKDLPRVAKASMTLAGAIIMILAMANALINFVIDQRIPAKVLETMLGFGLHETWQFLIVLNIFLLFLGMLMEGFSAILVAVPLIMPFAAQFHLQPFHLAVMFLLNLEIAYCAPPLGLNLFISSFRFNRPLVSLYRVVIPFTGILVAGLLITMYIPKVATVLVDGDIEKAYALAAQNKEPPREAWLLQCVQEDRLNPLPCTPEDLAKYGKDGTINPYQPAEAPNPDSAAPDPNAPTGDSDADLLREMMGGAPTGGDAPAKDSDEDLFKQMMEGAPDAGAKDKPKEKVKTDDELFKEMMGN